jgi:hypothetical protein
VGGEKGKIPFSLYLHKSFFVFCCCHIMESSQKKNLQKASIGSSTAIRREWVRARVKSEVRNNSNKKQQPQQF